MTLQEVAAPAPKTVHATGAADLEDVQARTEDLRQQINDHNYRYYVLDMPEISDADYDALMQELRAIEADHPELQSPDSPTQRVGAGPAEQFGVVEHRVPMLSLANAFNPDALRAWHERISRLIGREITHFTIEPKIDGLAIMLRYEAGRLTLGATRGDGFRGEDITANLKTIRTVPLALHDSPPERLEVRGEVYLSRAAFQKINDERAAAGQPLFANPRNCAAGSVRQLDSSVTARRPLEVFIYALGEADGWQPRSQWDWQPRSQWDWQPRSQWDMLEAFSRWGFRTNPHNRRVERIDEVVQACTGWERRRETLDYDIDGVVVKVDDLDLQSELGAVGREPRWAIAFKFPPVRATTLLKSIEVNVGRTGSLNPFAVLEPVKVGGVMVSQATLHNEEDIRRKDIRVGDTVLVHRAGEVIPQVIGPILSKRPPDAQPYALPSVCPVCGSPAVRPAGEAMARCTGGFSTCLAQRFELLKHFASRGAMDIEAVGEKLAWSLVHSGLVYDPSDLYRLTRDQLIALERMGDKSAHHVLDNIQASTSRSLTRVLYALGIRYVGYQTAELLARAFGSMERLSGAALEQIVEVEGIGPKIGESVYAWFHEPQNVRLVEKLQQYGVEMRDHSAAQTGPLAGLRFVVTGRLQRLSRMQIEQCIKALGGSVADSVSKKTSYLVMGDNAGSKLARAQKLGTPVLDEAAFLKLIEEQTHA